MNEDEKTISTIAHDVTSEKCAELRLLESDCESLKREAPPGFEPGMADLQSAALAAWRRGRESCVIVSGPAVSVNVDRDHLPRLPVLFFLSDHGAF